MITKRSVTCAYLEARKKNANHNAATNETNNGKHLISAHVLTFTQQFTFEDMQTRCIASRINLIGIGGAHMPHAEKVLYGIDQHHGINTMAPSADRCK